jgi:hypothetical protein
MRPDFDPDPDSMARFYGDHQALRSEVSRLQLQMLASSEWINSIAEQNPRWFSASPYIEEPLLGW